MSDDYSRGYAKGIRELDHGLSFAEVEQLREENARLQREQDEYLRGEWKVYNSSKENQIMMLRVALMKAEGVLSGIMRFYGQGLEVSNWHQNGDAEPWDNFFDENMSGDELEVIRAALEESK